MTLMTRLYAARALIDDSDNDVAEIWPLIWTHYGFRRLRSSLPEKRMGDCRSLHFRNLHFRRLRTWGFRCRIICRGIWRGALN